MPFPADPGIDSEIRSLYDKVSDPGPEHFVSGNAARLTALSVRRLSVAIDQAAQIQLRIDERMERLTKVGTWLAVVGVVLAVVQVVVAIMGMGQ